MLRFIIVCIVGLYGLEGQDHNLDDLVEKIENLKENASRTYEQRDQKLHNLSNYAEERQLKRIMAIQLRREKGEQLVARGEELIKDSEIRATNVTMWLFNIMKKIDNRKQKNEEKFKNKMARVHRMMNRLSVHSPPLQLCENDEMCGGEQEV